MPKRRPPGRSGHAKRKPPKPKGKEWSSWGLFVDVWRAVRGKPDPVPLGPDTSSAKHLRKICGHDREKLRDVYRLFLTDKDSWLRKQGYPLRHCVPRINHYLWEIKRREETFHPVTGERVLDDLEQRFGRPDRAEDDGS
ncbi:MAG: hypothetical protein ACOC8H_00835 [bacterium]